MYIYQSLATSILYTIKFLNILTSPSMCKQEDYFKKLIYMHNKKYISMSCKHREAQAVQSFGIRDNRALQIHISDWKLLFKPAVGLQSKTKSYPDAVYSRKHFSLRNSNLVVFFLPVRISGWEGEKMRWLWRKKKWEKKPTFEMYTFSKQRKKTPTIYSLSHCTLIMPTC